MRSSAVVVGLIVLAALLRFATLDVQSFEHDEAVTAGDVLDPNFIEMLKVVPERESTPPLYYVMAWLWSKLFGTGEVGLRTLSALIGTAVVPVAYALGAKLASRRIGVVACALVAVNPMLVWYSQEARAYSLLVLTSAVSVLLFAYALESPTRRRLTLWAIASALTLATHYFGLFLITAEAVWLLTTWRRGRDVLLAIGGVIAAGLLLAPLAVSQADSRTGFIAEIPLGDRLRDVAHQFLVGPRGDELAYVVPLATVLVGVGLALLAWRAKGAERHGARVTAVLGFAVVLMPLGLAVAGADRVLARNLLPALVPLMLVVAVGLGARRSGLLGAAATVGLCAVSVLVVIRVADSPDLQRRDWRGAAELIRAGPSAAVFAPIDADDPLGLYLNVDDYWEGIDPPVTELVVVRSQERRAPTVAGFEQMERHELARGLRVTRLRSSRPRRIRPSALARLQRGVQPEQFHLLLYEASGSR